jgi:hypothetical protein
MGPEKTEAVPSKRGSEAGKPPGPAKAGESRVKSEPAKAGTVWPFTLKTAAASVGGAILTVCVAAGQITYSRHLDRITAQREQGVQLQQALLEATGEIERAIRSTLAILRDRDAPDRIVRARAYYTDVATPALERWSSGALILRNRAANLYGRAVADRVYLTGDQTFMVDDCSVVVRPDDPATDRNCDARAAAERDRLTSLVTRIRGSTDLEPFRESPELPKSVYGNIYLANFLLNRYIGCLETAARPQQGQQQNGCRRPDVLLQSAIRRWEILQFARVNLANEIMNAAN